MYVNRCFFRYRTETWHWAPPVRRSFFGSAAGCRVGPGCRHRVQRVRRGRLGGWPSRRPRYPSCRRASALRASQRTRYPFGESSLRVEENLKKLSFRIETATALTARLGHDGLPGPLAFIAFGDRVTATVGSASSRRESSNLAKSPWSAALALLRLRTRCPRAADSVGGEECVRVRKGGRHGM